jgi:hypothetical protein
MALSGGLTLSCSDKGNRRGGVKRLWITDSENITSFTSGSDHEYNAVVVASGTFYKYEFLEFSMSVSNEGAKENGSSIINTSLEFTIPKLDKTKAKKLQELVELCTAVIVFEDYNDTYFVSGWCDVLEKGAGMTVTVSEIIGAGLQDSAHYQVSASGISSSLMKAYTGDVTDVTDFEQ